MRVIAGIAGGVRLEAPKGDSVRPTTDRVKESMFAVLGDLREKRILDLFAGTGALGLEALSRGASCVDFVDSDPRQLGLIERNLAAVRKAMNDECAETRVIRADAAKIWRLPSLSPGSYDIILADPPYHGSLRPSDLLEAPDFVQFAGSALVVIEHDRTVRLVASPASPWQLLKSSAFGTTVVSYLRVKSEKGKERT